MAKLHPFAVYNLVRTVGVAAKAGEAAPLAVGGPRGLADVLARELGRDAAPGAVRVGGPEGAAALVYVLAAAPGDEDERVLREAHRRLVPVVCVLAEPELEARVPYVLATDIVRVAPGAGFPVEAIAEALANRLDERGAPVAARVPVLRRAVRDHLIANVARKNAILGAAIFVPGADMPALTLNQIRLALLLAVVHGHEVGEQRAPEIASVVGGGFAFRTLARKLFRTLPVPEWALRATVAYAGTRAVGEAAARYFEARPAPDGSQLHRGGAPSD